MIGDDVEIILTRIERDSVRIAIKAPQSVRIFRGELYEKVNAPGSDKKESEEGGTPSTGNDGAPSQNQD